MYYKDLKVGRVYHSKNYNSYVFLVNIKDNYSQQFLILNSDIDNRLDIRKGYIYASGNSVFNQDLLDVTDYIDTIKINKVLYSKEHIEILMLLYEK